MNGVNIIYSVEEINNKLNLDAMDFVRHVLRDVLNNKVKFLRDR
jgi:hypothetical protein